MCPCVTRLLSTRRRRGVRTLFEALAVASVMVSCLTLGFVVGQLRRGGGGHEPPGQIRAITREQLDAELSRFERGVEREMTDQLEKFRTLAGRVDKRLGAPPRKPADELHANGEDPGTGGKARAREKARLRGLALPHAQASPESTESVIRD